MYKSVSIVIRDEIRLVTHNIITNVKSLIKLYKEEL